MAEPLRILSHLPIDALGRVVERVGAAEGALDWRHVAPDAEVPPDARGEVLLTFAWGGPNLPALVERGVRWIHTIGTGVDRFPLGAVGDRVLTCARGASAVPIAEWVMAMVLAHAKRLPESWAEAPPARWNHARLDGLHERVLGIVGLGSIARAVAERARVFGMRVRGVRRTPGPSPIPGVEIAASLEALVAGCQHLVIAAPATAETRHLVGAELLTHARELHLVNIARGSLVDQDALRAALDDGRVARASLDVCEPEPLPEGHWLYAHPQVYLSPHISWAAPGSFGALLDTFAENLIRYRAGEPLEGVVDVDAGY